MCVTNNKKFVFGCVCVCVCVHKCCFLFYLFCTPKVHFFFTGGTQRLRLLQVVRVPQIYESEDRFSLPLVAIRFQGMDVMALTAVGS